MSINIIQLVQGALTESVLQQLATKLGVAPEAAKRVVGMIAPAMVGSLMNKASSPEGARGLFASIMSPDSNANIVEMLPQLVHGDGLQSLLASGTRLATGVASEDRINAMSNAVAAKTGVSVGATHALGGIVTTALFGVLKHYFTRSSGNVGQLPTLLGHQLPMVKASMSEDISSALGLGGAGTFLSGVAALLKAVSSHLEHPSTSSGTSSATNPSLDKIVVEEKARSKKWWWLAVAAALALLALLFGRSCTNQQSLTTAPAEAPVVTSTPAVAEPASAPASAPAAVAAPAPTKDALLTFTVDKLGAPTIHATVGSEEEKAKLLAALTAKFGADHLNATITVDPDTKPASWLDKLDGLLPLMQLPGAEAKLSGEKIELSGSAADARNGWMDKLKSLFGAGFTVGTFDVKQAVESAKESFMSAFSSLNSDCAPADVAKVLNLQVINFRTGSDVPPQDAQLALAKSAQMLKSCQDAGKAVKLNIGGYSDNVGLASSNLALSKKRAEAVRAFLVKHGVSADSLMAQGYGDQHPIADNSTASGRFANRRIDFAVQE
ncbi:OmpA/MotB domain-containing protein [Caballeronia sordidicola]|uniref:OmpA/MotB domain-containing protein n=1 Tax=Caballeronia sordidicola TaxID=196367 RepID=A0A158FEB2_CABSO|nr:OmpA family protein [Caballeronia sordidicola]SAL18134.1 OmpA/MotB domain-containing protein [Caballeronia sordidicola]